MSDSPTDLRKSAAIIRRKSSTLQEIPDGSSFLRFQTLTLVAFGVTARTTNNAGDVLGDALKSNIIEEELVKRAGGEHAMPKPADRL
jgi:hypothetical protein